MIINKLFVSHNISLISFKQLLCALHYWPQFFLKAVTVANSYVM